MPQGDPATRNPDKGYVALLGWSLNAVEALDRFDRRYVVVAPEWAEEYCVDHDIPYLPWDFERLNDRSMEIAETLQNEGVDVAIPLFEETVEWAGAINSVLLDNPRLYGQALLLRDKALMKRRAQLGGIRVGIFEEAHDRDDVIRFLKRVNQTLLKLDGDPNDPIHLKAFDKAGCLGHRVIRTPDEVDTIPEEEFPVLMESHLDGWEFAVEAWVHNGKIKFLNISEYVTLGYSVFVPATPELERYRPQITAQIEKLIKTFDIEFGFVHPEYFVTSDGEMYFGEVAYRPPGFKVFELLERAYGFNAYHAPGAGLRPEDDRGGDRRLLPARGRRRVRGRRLLRCLPAPPRRQRPGDPGGDRGRRLLRVARPLDAARGDCHQENRVRNPLGPGVLLR